MAALPCIFNWLHSNVEHGLLDPQPQQKHDLDLERSDLLANSNKHKTHQKIPHKQKIILTMDDETFCVSRKIVDFSNVVQILFTIKHICCCIYPHRKMFL